MKQFLLICLSILFIFGCSQKKKKNEDEKMISNSIIPLIKNYLNNDSITIEKYRITDDSIRSSMFKQLNTNDISLEEYLSCDKPRKPVETGKTKYFIVRNAYFNDIEILKQNAAILITDKEIIAENEKMFFNNPKPAVHTCGFHFDIEFWENPYNCNEYISYNTECERYCFDEKIIRERVLDYVKQLRVKPTHYAYSFDVHVRYTPARLLDIFKETDMHIFISNYDYDNKTKSKYYSVTLFDETDNLNSVKKNLKKYLDVKNLRKYNEGNYRNISIKPYDYDIVDKKPQFPGGDKELKKYLKDNLRYPSNSAEEKPEKEVLVRLTITQTGNIHDVRVVSNVSNDYMKSAYSVVRRMPKWKPAVHDGENVPVYVIIPIRFE